MLRTAVHDNDLRNWPEIDMTEASAIAIQILGILAGSLCLYIAFFLYEDEESRVQNALENFWIRVNDRSDRASTFIRHLVTEAAGLSSRAFDAIFGPTLFSMRAVGVSFSYALASMSVYLIAATGRANVPALWVMPLIFAALGSLPALTGSRRIERLIFLLPLAFAIFLIMFTGMIASEYFRSLDPYGPEFLLINYILIGALALSVPIDFLWALLARWGARKVSESQRMLPMLISLLIYLAAPGILIAIGQPGMVSGVMHWNPWLGSLLVLIMASRAFLVVTASVFIMVFGVVLLHKIVWPLVDRTIYALARHRVLQNRRLVGVIGFALIVGSVGGAPFNPAQFHWMR